VAPWYSISCLARPLVRLFVRCCKLTLLTARISAVAHGPDRGQELSHLRFLAELNVWAIELRAPLHALSWLHGRHRAECELQLRLQVGGREHL